MPRRRIISIETITKFGRLCYQHNRLEKLRYAMRAELLDLMNQGWTPSDKGPYVLMRGSQRRLDAEQWSWKMYALQLATELEKGNVLAALRRITLAENAAPKKNVDVLSAKVNPFFGLKIKGFGGE